MWTDFNHITGRGPMRDVGPGYGSSMLYDGISAVGDKIATVAVYQRDALKRRLRNPVQSFWDSCPRRAGSGHRHGRLPARQDRVLPTHPGVVPAPSRPARTERRRGDRRAPRRQRAAPSPLSARDPPSRRQTQRRTCRRRMPASAPGRRSDLSHNQRDPRRRDRTRRPTQPDAACSAPAHLHGPARLFNPDIANNDEGVA